MNNPWKLATLGLVLAGFTALSTGVTTAYLMRPAVPDRGVIDATAVAAPRTNAVPIASVASRPRPVAVVTPAVATRPTTVTPVAAPAPVADGCATGGERAMKIAKPGLVGTLAGAGLGAIGGAVIHGGSGAGKGALVGGLAGAALGSGYGAYKTQQECGTIFGHAGGATPVAAFSTPAALRDRTITVYDAR